MHICTMLQGMPSNVPSRSFRNASAKALSASSERYDFCLLRPLPVELVCSSSSSSHASRETREPGFLPSSDGSRSRETFSVGVFGGSLSMSDDFEGRFSTDDGAAFPLAELKLVATFAISVALSGLFCRNPGRLLPTLLDPHDSFLG